MDALPARETLPSLIRRCLSEPREAAVVERVNHVWTPASSGELLARADRVAAAIRNAGLNEGDRIALISANRADWIVADFGTLIAGCVVVPVFPTQAPDQVAYILTNSEAKIVFVDSLAAAERLRNAGVPLPRTVIFEGEGEDSLAAFERAGERALAAHPDWPGALTANTSPDDMAVLIYTSGTTGDPKGVMLSHYNIVFNAQATFAHAMDVIVPGSDVLSVLTFSHIYEHTIMYGYMVTRVHHYVSHDVNELLNDLRDVRPVVMTAVPRIFERMIAGITARAKQHGGLQAKIVPWALQTGADYMGARTRKTNPGLLLTIKYRIADALVLRKLKPLLGLDRIKFLVSGSAPLHFDVAMTMLAAGIPIVEGYGPTECSPVITANLHSDNHYGTVGRPIPGVQIKVAPDGEILAKGPNVMLGYYRDPAATAEVMEDGWYRTGDIGEIDAEGFLRITDRKKELFKTSGGKFVAPSRVEAAIKRSVYINQVMLVGDSRPHPAALVSPNWDLLRVELNLPAGASHSELAKRPDVVEFVTREVRQNTADLAKFEQVRTIGILPRELTIEDGDLSPTLKVKRRVVEAKFGSLVDQMYAQMSAPTHA